MPSVIVLDDLSQEGLDLLEAAEGVTYEVKTGLKGEELREALTHFDGAICRSGVKLTEDILEEPFVVENGHVIVPDTPGLGGRPDMDKIAKFSSTGRAA